MAETAEGKRWKRAARYRRTLRGHAYGLCRSAKRRALAAHADFTITREWVLRKLLGGRCAQTGVEFTFGIHDPGAPSLDQIKPGRGYTPENTQVVCWFYNRAKGNLSDEQAWQFLRTIHKAAA